MLRKKYIELAQLLRTMGNLPGSSLWARAAVLNLNKIAPELKALQEMQTITPEIKAFAEAAEKLAIKYADKDKKSNPIRNEQEQYVVRKQENVYNMKLKELKEIHSDAIDQEKEINLDILAFADKEIEIELVKIRAEDLPNQITPAQYQVLELMVEEKSTSNIIPATVLDDKQLRQVNG